MEFFHSLAATEDIVPNLSQIVLPYPMNSSSKMPAIYEQGLTQAAHHSANAPMFHLDNSAAAGAYRTLVVGEDTSNGDLPQESLTNHIAELSMYWDYGPIGVQNTTQFFGIGLGCPDFFPSSGGDPAIFTTASNTPYIWLYTNPSTSIISLSTCKGDGIELPVTVNLGAISEQYELMKIRYVPGKKVEAFRNNTLIYTQSTFAAIPDTNTITWSARSVIYIWTGTTNGSLPTVFGGWALTLTPYSAIFGV